MFLLFCFDRQLITPKFPVVVKIGHAHQGLGKVRWLSSLLTLRLVLLSYLLSSASLSLAKIIFTSVCVCERERLLSFAFSDGHQFSIILLIRFLLSDNTVCSSVLQVRIIAKKKKTLNLRMKYVDIFLNQCTSQLHYTQHIQGFICLAFYFYLFILFRDLWFFLWRGIFFLFSSSQTRCISSRRHP